MSAFCTTCGRAAGNPSRVYDSDGRVLSGCVDAFHTGHLPGLSETLHWHNRSEAKRIRQRSAKFWGVGAAR